MARCALAHQHQLCDPCVRALTADLLAVPWLLAQTIEPRDARRVATAIGSARHILDRHARTVANQHHLVLDASALIPLANWLARHVASLRQCPQAPHIHADIRDAIAALRYAIGCPPPILHAGHCTRCRMDVYCPAGPDGEPTATVVVCGTCRHRQPLPPLFRGPRHDRPRTLPGLRCPDLVADDSQGRPDAGRR